VIKHQRALSGVLAVAVAGALATGSAVTASTGTADHDRLRAVMQRLTTVDGGPGALIRMRDRRGDAVLTSGVADVASRAPIRGDSTFRIGSMTKTFVATTVLQLVGEGRVVLDAPVERYLPGVVRGHGNDGRTITVRQLLQHTSRIPNYLTYLSLEDILKDPLAHYDTRDLVNIALAHPPTPPTATGYRYSNTNYLLAGMLIETVTGHTYGQEIRRRIIEPLGLRQTYCDRSDAVVSTPGSG
jgi:D-alanyl-D-alanine carboxypeptidase